MREFPAWNRPSVEWPDLARLRPAQLRRLVGDLGAGGGAAVRAIPLRVVELARQTRSRCEQLPNAVAGELRRRVNPLDLATKHDVEVQSKLGRNRVSFVLNEFLEGQRSHDEALLALVRAELREELQSFAATLSDDLLAIDTEELAEIDTHGPDDEAIDLVDPASNRRWTCAGADEPG